MLLNILNAFYVMIIGMVVVFIGLIILIGSTKLMSRMLNRTGKRPPAEPQPAALPAMAEEPAEEGIAPEIVVAISAALAAFESAGKKLVVRSVRRAKRWTDAGRSESNNY